MADFPQDNVMPGLGMSVEGPIPETTPVPEPIPVAADPGVEPATAEQRAVKYHKAMGPAGPSMEQIRDSLITGGEESMRKHALVQYQLNERSKRTQLVQQAVEAFKDKPISQDDIQSIYKLSDPAAQGMLDNDPKTFFEKQYAKQLLEESLRKDNKTPQEENLYRVGTNIIANKEYAQRLFEDLSTEYKQQSWPGWIGDFTSNMIPGKSWYRQQNILGKESSFLKGSNVEEQAYSYYQMPPEQASQKLYAAVQQLKGRNLQEALSFLGDILSIDPVSKVLGNAQAIGDLLFLTPAPVVGGYSASLALKTLRAAQTASRATATAVGDVVRGATRSATLSPAQAAENAGDLTRAGATLLREKLDQLPGAPVSSYGQLQGELHGIDNVSEVLGGEASSFSTETLLRMRNTLEHQATELVRAGMLDPVSIDLLTPEQLKATIESQFRLWRQQYPHLVDGVVNVRPIVTTARGYNEMLARRTIEDKVEGLKQRLVVDGDAQNYSDYVRLAKQFEDNSQYVLADIGDPTRSMFGYRPGKTEGAIAKDKNYWKNVFKQIKDADALDESKRALVRESVEFMETLTPQQKRTFAAIRGAEDLLPKLKSGFDPDVTAVKGIGNIDYLAVHLGKKGGQKIDITGQHLVAMDLGDIHEASLFKGATAQEGIDQAKHWAQEIYQLRPGTYTINQKGDGYVVTMYKPIDVNDPAAVSALRYETAANPSANGYLGQVDRLLSPELTLSKETMADRYTAVYGSSKLREAIAAALKPIAEVPRKYSPTRLWRKGSREDLVKFLEDQRVYKDPSAPADTTPGKFSKTQGEFEREWFNNYKRQPTEAESLAYWSYVQASQFEWGVRNIDLLAKKSRLGWELHSFGTIDNHTPGTPMFEGKFLKEVPRDISADLDHGTLVLDPQSGNFDYIRRYGGASVRGPSEGAPKTMYFVNSADGTRQFKKPVEILGEKTDKKTGDTYVKFKDPEDGKNKWWPKGQMEETSVATKAAPEETLLSDRKAAVPPTKDLNRDRVDSYTQQGYKTVQLTKYGETELRRYLTDIGVKNLPEGGINFVMSKALDSGPLPIKQLPNRPGGHHVYLAPYYLRQPKLVQMGDALHYYEDRNMFGFESLEQGKKFEEAFNTAREGLLAYQAGRESRANLSAYISRNLPYRFDTFEELFKGGGYNINTPFFLTPANMSTDKAHNLAGLYGNRFKNMNHSDLNMYKDIQGDFLGERGDTLYTIAREGSVEMPTFRREEARMVAALPTLDRALTSALRGRYMEDLKWKTANRYVIEWQDIMNATPRQLQENPTYYLFHPQYKTGVVDRDQIMAAENYRIRATQLFGARTDFQKDIDWMKLQGQNIVFGNARALGEKVGVLGPKVEHETLDQWVQYDLPWYQKFKNAAFDFKMAWSPVQLFVQAQSASLAVARDPLAGLSGARAAFVHLFAKNVTQQTPEDLGKVGSWLAGQGWTAQEYRQAAEGLRRTGFGTVGREVADMQDFMRPGMIRGISGPMGEAWGAFNDVGRMFFRGGESFARETAWFTAYKRWLVEHPGQVATDAQLREILAVADKHNVHMSAASAASWQKGAFSVPTQFWGFQAKLMQSIWSDMFSGSAMRRGEAYRILGMNALMYGAPVGIAGALFAGFPFPESARKYALSNGKDWDENWYTRLPMNGFMNEFLRQFGSGDETNVAERYGPNSSIITDLMNKNTFAMATGIFGTTLADAYLASDPYRMMIAGLFTDQGYYEPKWHDFTQVLDLYSGIKSMKTALIAINTGNYYNKRGEVVANDITVKEGLQKLMFGVDPIRVTDFNKSRMLLKEEAALKQELLPVVRDNFMRAHQAFKNDDDENGVAYMNRARAALNAGGWKEHEYHTVFKQIAPSETEIDQVARKMATSDSRRLKALISKLERRGK